MSIQSRFYIRDRTDILVLGIDDNEETQTQRLGIVTRTGYSVQVTQFFTLHPSNTTVTGTDQRNLIRTGRSHVRGLTSDLLESLNIWISVVRGRISKSY